MYEDPIALKIVSGLTFVAILVFILLFSREPWRRTEFGRSLMAMSVGVLLFASLSALRAVFGPDYPGREVVRFSAFVFVFYAIVTRTWTLWKLQRRDADAGRGDNRRGSDNKFT